MNQHDFDRQHIGDGVYASHDGYHVWLRLSLEDRGIALEPPVIDGLVTYAVDHVGYVPSERVMNALGYQKKERGTHES